MVKSRYPQAVQVRLSTEQYEALSSKNRARHCRRLIDDGLKRSGKIPESDLDWWCREVEQYNATVSRVLTMR